MVAAARSYAPHFSLGRSTRMLQVTSYIWLPCSVEVIATLLFGGRVCIPSDEDRSINLEGFMKSHAIDTAVMTPSMLSSLDPDFATSLKVLGVGGEKLTQTLVDNWAAKVDLVLAYGSTETNLCLVQHIQSGPLQVRAIPIGCRAMVVDPEDRSKQLQVGMVGELLIESAALAQGYLNDPDRTTNKFLPSASWSSGPRSVTRTRLCATGDLAEMNSDGTFKFHGRIDKAVKIRGQKVNPNGVMTIMQRYLPRHMTLAVEPATLAGDAGTTHLVAFVGTTDALDDPANADYCSPQTKTALQSLLRQLGQELPSYLIPTGILPLTELPLNSSGKIDRNKLLSFCSTWTPQQLACLLYGTLNLEPPRSSFEILLHGLWCKHLALGQDELGLDSHFIRSGGHSLLAIRIASEARKMGFDLSIDAFIRCPVLRDLAACLEPLTPALVWPSAFSLLSHHGNSKECLNEIRDRYHISRTQLEDVYPATPTQTGMIAATMRRPEAFVAQIVSKLETSIDLERFKLSWQAVVSKNAILRTIVLPLATGMVQVVLRQAIPWREKQMALGEYLEEDRRAPLILNEELLRFGLVNDQDSIHFVMTAHHALFDAWSITLIFEQFRSVFVGKQHDSLPPYSLFVRHLLEGSSTSKKSFWIGYLDQASVIDFPVSQSFADHIRPKTRIKRAIGFERMRHLETTDASIVHAAWALLLSEHTSENDIIFGTVLSGRIDSLEHLDRLPGPTIFTVPLRVNAERNQDVANYLLQVQGHLQDITTNGQLSLHEISRLGVHPKHACQFQTLLIVQMVEESPQILGADVQVGNWMESSQHAITLECNIRKDHLDCDLSFDESITGIGQIDLLLSQFEILLNYLSGKKEVHLLKDVHCFSLHDHRQIIEWNTTGFEPALCSSVQLIHRRCLETPKAQAVVSWNGNIIYAELDHLSNLLAAYLSAELAIGPACTVPLLFEKSLWVVVAMLGVWKTGAAWILLDISHPEHWLEKVMKQVNAELFLTSERGSQMLPEFAKHLVVDGAFLSTLQYSSYVNRSRLQDTAFVLYTSGSTGEPKLIPHDHQAYLAGLFARLRIMHRDETSRVLQFSSYGFDAAIEDIISTLIVGGTVFIPSDHDRDNNLEEFARANRITHLDLTPSLALTLDPDRFPFLQVLTLGGEAVTESHRDLWASRVTLINAYGPSEIAITSHTKVIRPEDDPGEVGPGCGCWTWITLPDDHNQLQAIGCVGELLLEGPILSRGYLNSPIQTRTAFISDLGWAGKSTNPRVFYKTGDLAKYTPDGSVQLLGRKDTQTKLRGQRVELSQVEHFVRTGLPFCIDIVAELVALQQHQVTKSLVVFVTLREDLAQVHERRAELYGILTQQLPNHMVPVAIIVLEKLPMGITGKVDRTSLAGVAQSTTCRDIVYLDDKNRAVKLRELLKDPVERSLGDLFAQSLGLTLPRIDRMSHFIHAGGDSILAMKMVALAYKNDLKLDLTVEKIFRYPVLKDLAQAITSRSQPKQETVTKPFELLRSDHFGTWKPCKWLSEALDIGEGLVEDAYPCSPLQAGLMALSTVNPGNYVSQQVFTLNSDLDMKRFKDAWKSFASQTAILRTRILQTETEMLQVVIRDPIVWADHRNLDAYLEQDKQLGMFVGQALVRYALIEEAEQTYFVLTIHHALYDGWSLSLMLERVADLYLQRTSSDCCVQYSVFVKFLSTLNREEHSLYWEAYFRGSEEQSLMYPRCPDISGSRRADTSFDLTVRLPEKRLPKITTATAFQAAWGLVASHHLNTRDTIFGNTRAGRSAPIANVSHLVGPTFTTVPVRIRYDEAETIGSYLSRVQEESFSSIPHEHLGLQNIKAISADTEAACKFSTLLVIHPQGQDQTVQELFTNHQARGDISQFNPTTLMIQFIPSSATIWNVNASFDPLAVEGHQLRRLLCQTEHVARQLLTLDQDQCLQDVELVSNTDREEILAWNNNGHTPAFEQYCVHDLISKQAQSQPTAQAVNSWDGSLTYVDLEDLSSRLAQALTVEGVSHEDIILLYFEKSYLTVVSMLAVWKAGAVVVMLDPSHPHARLKAIADETRASMILTFSRGRVSFLPSDMQIIDISKSYLAALSAALSCPDTISPSSLATIIFTSGSTGHPKGILLEHSAVATSALAHGPAMNVNRTSRVFQFASYAFDMALYDICTTLVMGGCICIPSEQDRMERLPEVLTELGANWAFFTPSILSTFQPYDTPTLATIVVGGEFVSQDIINTWVDRVSLFQCSGPAETTTCLAGRMTRSIPRNCIGKPCGVLCWVVKMDDPDRLAPLGAVGEMVLEGPTLALGYLRDPNSEAFISARQMRWARDILPSSKSERRMYKTGDLVQQNTDGTFNLIGRKDGQVKLRGQRVEIGEIEHHINQFLPEVKAIAAVVFPKDGNTRAELATFVSTTLLNTGDPCHVAKAPKDFREKQTRLQDYLAMHLPRYMIPSRIIYLTGMPLNSSGKVDRKIVNALGCSLSVLDLDALEACHTSESMPLNAEEALLRKMWTSVLNINHDDIHAGSHFVRLGGDSIIAMRLVVVARHHGKLLTVQDIFRKPTLRCMAACLSELPTSDSITGSTPESDGGDSTSLQQLVRELGLEQISQQCGVREEDIEDIYPCTALQEGLMCLSAESPGDYTAQDVFELGTSVDVRNFKAACAKVAEVAPILRTCLVQLQDQRIVQAVLRPGISWDSAEDVEAYLQRDREAPIGFGSPLVRWALVNHDERRYFVWTRHHAAYDGDSYILALDAIEEAYATSGDAFLAKSRLDFKAFVSHIRNPRHESSAEYWKTTLRDVSSPRSLVVKSDNEPLVPASLRHTCACHTPSESAITTATRIRAALALIQARASGSEDVLFGEITSGRDVSLPGIESLIAPTFASVPLRLTLQDNSEDVEDFLARVQDQVVDRIPHQHFGLQNIMRLHPSFREVCQFQILLSIQPQIHNLKDNSILRPLRSESHAGFYTHPLTLICETGKDQIQFNAHFDAAKLSEAEVSGLLQQLGHVISQFCATLPAHTTIDEIDLATPSQIAHMESQNAQLKIPTVSACIHRVFEEQVSLYPDAVAVACHEVNWTYLELDSRATKLAIHLQSLGVCQETLVPIFIGKSPWFVLAVLAVLKAGGAYVGLDPSHQAGRSAEIIRETHAFLVVSTALYRANLGPTELSVIELSEVFLASLTEVADNWIDRSKSEDAAMVVFTSGSTGTPKGIVLEHFAICSAAAIQAPALGIGPGVRTLHFASPAWDVLFAEVFMPLMTGGCVCIPSDDGRDNDLPKACRFLQPNWMLLTPKVLALYHPSDFPSIRTLVTGGEIATSSVLETWCNMPDRFINIYGPAECSLFCIWNQHHGKSGGPERIGVGLTAQLWVVHPDNHDILLPTGSVGELLIEGPVLARGYLHDAAKTESAFISDPKWARSSNRSSVRRLYKTGDLIRQNHDNTFDIIGRKDNQIKINSQRFDPGEVENAIRQLLPPEWTCVVDKIEPNTNSSVPCLIAFMTTSKQPRMMDDRDNLLMEVDTPQQNQLTQLRKDLVKSLPSFMIPALYIPLRKLPTNNNQKLDRTGLRKLAQELTEAQHMRFRQREDRGRPAEGPKEEALVALWSSILGMPGDKIAGFDSFFVSGGDSILAMKLASSARSKGMNLSVKQIFMNPVLSDMAGLLSIDGISIPRATTTSPPPKDDQYTRQEPHIEAVCDQLGLLQTDVKAVYPATGYQQQAIAATLLSTRGLLGYFFFTANQTVDIEKLKQALDRLVSTHDILRTVFVQHHGELYQAVLRNVFIGIRIHETDRDTLSVARQICLQDLSKPLSLTESFTRFFLVKNIDSDIHTLVIRLSHSQYDGLCIPHLWHSIQQSYSGIPMAIPEPSFSTYISKWQAARSSNWQTYWSGILDHASPTYLVRRSRPAYWRLEDAIPRAIRKASLAVQHTRNFTTSTYMRAAWALTLMELLDVSDVIFLSTVSGRNVPIAGVEAVVGACINIVPVRVKVLPSTTVHNLIDQVHHQLIEGISYELTEFREIIRQCTNWPSWVRVGSIIQHDDHVSAAPPLQLGSTVYETASFCNPAEIADVAIHTTVKEDELVLRGTSLSAEIDTQSLDLILSTFTEKIRMVHSDATIAMPAAKSLTPAFPLLAAEPAVAGKLLSNTTGKLDALDERMDSLRRLWSEALKAPSKAGQYAVADSFFDVGGDLVSVAYLTSSLQRQGYCVVMEDIIARPHLGEMAELLFSLQSRRGVELEQ